MYTDLLCLVHCNTDLLPSPSQCILCNAGARAHGFIEGAERVHRRNRRSVPRRRLESLRGAQLRQERRGRDREPSCGLGWGGMEGGMGGGGWLILSTRR